MNQIDTWTPEKLKMNWFLEYVNKYSERDMPIIVALNDGVDVYNVATAVHVVRYDEDDYYFKKPDYFSDEEWQALEQCVVLLAE